MERILTALRAAGEQTRLRLLAILAQGELTVKELTQVLEQSQPRISRHLKLLTESGLVVRYPEESWVFYRLADSPPVAHLGKCLIDFLPDNDSTLKGDRARLKQVRAKRAKRAQNYFSANAANWDSLRALHIADTDIENKMMQVVGRKQFELLVDLGTGTGRMLEVFGGRAKRAIGFDINANMLALARANLDKAHLPHCQVRLADVTNLPLPSGFADFVIMHQLLHFLENPNLAIREAARLLTQNGLLLIVDFAPHNMEALREAHAHRRLGFTDDEILSMLKEAGLTPSATQYLPAPEKNGKGQNNKNMLTVYLWSARRTNNEGAEIK